MSEISKSSSTPLKRWAPNRSTTNSLDRNRGLHPGFLLDVDESQLASGSYFLGIHRASCMMSNTYDDAGTCNWHGIHKICKPM